MLVKAAELAVMLGVSAPRVSQYVSEGKLAGCFHGDGRARRFDVDACAAALGQKLDPGQMMSNGSRTRQMLDRLNHGNPVQPAPGGENGGRFELARIEKVEQEARRLRRDNDLAAGTLVLADSVERTVAKAMGQEVAQFETVLRNGAGLIASTFKIDSRAVHQLLRQAWREYRTGRSGKLGEAAETATMTEQEQAADF